jgi:Flp pilus assembly pilin Flp
MAAALPSNEVSAFCSKRPETTLRALFHYRRQFRRSRDPREPFFPGKTRDADPNSAKGNGEEMMEAISRFVHDERGATSIEYALIAVIVSVSILGVLIQISDSLNGALVKVGTSLAEVIQ